jgi:uncharacterized protein YkwD
MTTTRQLVKELGTEYTDAQKGAIEVALRAAVFVEGQLLRAIASVQDDLAAAAAAVNSGRYLNELGVLRWNDVDRLAAVRHERIQALVLVLAATDTSAPETMASYMISSVTSA